MLTERKMFSRSFASSAVSGELQDLDRVADLLVEGAGALGAGGGDAADQLRRGADRVVGAARVDPLRREGQEEVLADRATALRQGGEELLAGGAGVGGRLEHDQLAGLQVGGDLSSRLAQVGEVGLARARQRRRHADDDRLAVLQVGVVGWWRSGARPAPRARRRRRPRCSCGRRPGRRACRGRCRGRRRRSRPRRRRGRGEARRSRGRRSPASWRRRDQAPEATTDSAASRVCQVGKSGTTYQAMTDWRASAISCEYQ